MPSGTGRKTYLIYLRSMLQGTPLISSLLPFASKRNITSMLLAVVCAVHTSNAVGTNQPQNAKPVNSEVPPQLVLGQRIEQLRAATSYINTVVVVSDAQSYVAAISAWTKSARFPVLIDDGSSDSRDDIARFVRGYQPVGVVRFALDDNTIIPGDAGFNGLTQERVDVILRTIWTTPPASQPQPASIAPPLAQAMLAAGHTPAGVVLAHRDDPAWAGGLALAAAIGQPMMLLGDKPEGNIDWSLTIEKADQLEKDAQRAATGFAYDRLGDQIDSVTLALNIPERIKVDNEFLALSDRIGRIGEGVKMTTRWAWCGHLFGSPSRSTYAAMCSLFLHPRRAWIFDGYEDNQPWNLYDGTKAGDILTQHGIKCDVDDTPKQGADSWRTRASTPVTADLIFVNTKGNADFFDLRPGQCKPGDLPMLQRPAALHFVHSWSLLFPGKRETVGGRWLERGVFAYAGSVHEPFLQAFTPTPNVAGRLVSGASFAPAIRIENQPVWKIAVIGDPLYTPGPPAKRVDSPLPGRLSDCKPIDADLKEMLQREDYVGGILAMKLRGRDADISKLIDALVQSKPAATTPGLLREGVLASFYSGQIQTFTALYARLPPTLASDGVMLDCLWLAAGPALVPRPAAVDPEDKQMLSSEQAQAMLRLLRSHVRPDQIESDASRLATAWKREFGPASSIELFATLRKLHTKPEDAKALDAAQGK